MTEMKTSILNFFYDLLEVHGLQHSGEGNPAHHGVVELRAAERQAWVMFMNSESLEPPKIFGEVDITSNGKGHKEQEHIHPHFKAFLFDRRRRNKLKQLRPP